MEIRRKRLQLCVAVTAALAGLAIRTCFAEASGVGSEGALPAPALTVTVAAAAIRQWPEMIAANGAIDPWQEIVISAQVAGQHIDELLVEVGDAVTAGQTLARMDRTMLEAEVEELAAVLAQAEANLVQATADAARAVELEKKAALSAQEILRYRTQQDVARAQVRSSQARLQARRLQLDRTQVQAPDAGLVSDRRAKLGEVPSLGQELFRLIRQGRLEWRGELTAAQLTRVAPEQSITIRLPDGTETTARVRKLAPALRSENRLAVVFADLDAGSSARAGMYVEGTILLEPSDALAVPAASVVIRDGRSYVFSVGAKTGAARISARQVETGRRIEDEVEILRGIDAGDRVVVQGAGFLNDGDVVRIAGDAGKRAAVSGR